MYSGYRHVSSSFAYGTFTLSGLLSQNSSAGFTESIMRSEPRNARTPVWALSISLAATLEIDFSFSSSGYLDVSVHRVPFHTLWIGVWIHEVFSCGFPHSDISGSMDICSSPKLIAAYHVFHRLPVPRHSPCALVRLTFQTFFWNIWYPLDSLLPTKIIVTLPFEIAIFLKRTYYNLCFAVIIQFSRYVFECPFQGPQNRTISTLLVSVTCSRWPTIFDVLPSA